MYLSELIRILANVENENGDMPVRFIGTLPEDPGEVSIAIEGIAIIDDCVLICDDLTLDAIEGNEF